MFDNLKYLYTRSLILDTDYDEFFGWYGQSYSISDAIIAPINLCVYKTWDDLTCENGDKTSWDAFTCSDGDLVEGYLFSCAPYENFNCDNINRNQNCLGLHCLNWKWSALKSSTVAGATWKNMKTGGVLRKKWENDGHCESSDGEVIVSQACNVEGQWNLNEPQDGFINELYKNVDCNSGINSNCYPVDLASKENVIYSRVVFNSESIEKNHKLMDLGNPLIDENEKAIIEELVEARSYNLKLKEFLKLYHEDGLVNVLKNVDYWINDTFKVLSGFNK
jgi:hypothetical protein